MKDLMEWSRSVINSLMIKNNNSDDLYQIKITLNPNPLDYDGIDEVTIEIIEENQKTKAETVVYSTKKDYCLNIKQAKELVDKLVIK